MTKLRREFACSDRDWDASNQDFDIFPQIGWSLTEIRCFCLSRYPYIFSRSIRYDTGLDVPRTRIRTGYPGTVGYGTTAQALGHGWGRGGDQRGPRLTDDRTLSCPQIRSIFE